MTRALQAVGDASGALAPETHGCTQTLRTLHSKEPPTVVAADIYPDLYGAQRCLLSLYSRWHEEGRFRLHLIYFVEGALSEAFRSAGIPVTRLDPGPLLASFDKRLLTLRARDYARLALHMCKFNRTLKRTLLALGADLFHANTDRVGMMSFPGAHAARCPLVTHLRRDRSFGWRDRVLYAGSTQIAWVSRRVRDDFADAQGIAHAKGRVIYDGRALADRNAADTTAEVLAELGLPKNAKVALVVAAFDEAKDHEMLIRAARIACRAEPKLYVLLAGSDFSPNERRLTKIRSLAQAAGLSDRVLFLGHRTDVGRLMRGADVLLSSSKHEALGGAMIEAIGYGLPCVATDTGGTAEIVPDGRCGYLVPRYDHEGLARRTIDLLQDAEARQTFSVNAQAHFDAHFTMDRCAEETARYFEAIISNVDEQGSERETT